MHEVDRIFLLHGMLRNALRDPEYFRQVHVGVEPRTIVWPNGLDPSPELLRGEAPTGLSAAASTATS